MKKFRGSFDGSESVTTYYGTEIDSSFAYEPAEKYDEDCEDDRYHVEFITPDMPAQRISFNSLEQLLEFKSQLARFVASIWHQPNI